MKQLKAALLKAGFALPVEKPKPKAFVPPPKISKAPKTVSKKFDDNQIITECEHCGNHTPDVEYYRHNNRLIVKRWLCIKCADDNKIDDELRDTHQSSYSRSNRFRRMWGRTKSFHG